MATSAPWPSTTLPLETGQTSRPRRRSPTVRGRSVTVLPISPSASDSYGFGGISIDAQRPGVVMASSLNQYYPDAQVPRSYKRRSPVVLMNTHADLALTQRWSELDEPLQLLIPGPRLPACGYPRLFVGHQCRSMDPIIHHVRTVVFGFSV
jgi:hypothetical protein